MSSAIATVAFDSALGNTTAVSAATPLPVSSTLAGSGTTGTDRSITATTTSQQLMAANPARARFFVKNDSLIVVWINLGATAVAAAGSGNIAVAASGGYFELSGYTGAVNIIAASTTAAVTAREF